MRIEVAFALASRQLLVTVELARGSTVADAIAAGSLEKQFPAYDFDALQAGIWGKPVERDRVLHDGDRVELYRPLEMDPRAARRLKAGV